MKHMFFWKVPGVYEKRLKGSVDPSMTVMLTTQTSCFIGVISLHRSNREIEKDGNRKQMQINLTLLVESCEPHFFHQRMTIEAQRRQRRYPFLRNPSQGRLNRETSISGF